MEWEKRYSEKTVKAVKDFIADFQMIFPNLLSEDELLLRITTNMEYDIDFDATLDDGLMGEFDNKQISVDKSVKEKGQVLFHEFVHVITFGDFIKNFPYRNFIEGLTTLAEEMYVSYKNIRKPQYRRNINGYIPNFVRQLNFIKDGKLLNEFLREPKNIYKLFLPRLLLFNLPFGKDDKDYKRELDIVAKKNECIVGMANASESDKKIIPCIRKLEEDILEQCLTGIYTGKDKFSCEKLYSLYQMQIYPNIFKYVQILRALLRDGYINEDELRAKFGNLGVINLLDCVDEDILFDGIHYDIGNFNKNELDWLASKVFGYSSYIYDTEALIDCDTDLDKLFDERDYYEDIVPIYRELIEEVVNGQLDLNLIRNCRLRRCSVGKDSYNIQAYLRDVVKSDYQKLLDFIYSDENDVIGVVALEDDEGIKLVRSEEFFYYPTDMVSFSSLVGNVEAATRDIFLDYLKKYEDYDVVFLDKAVDFDIEWFGLCTVNMFVQKGTDLFKVKLSLENGMVSEMLEAVTFMEDGKSVFEKNTKKKLKSKVEDF